MRGNVRRANVPGTISSDVVLALTGPHLLIPNHRLGGYIG